MSYGKIFTPRTICHLICAYLVANDHKIKPKLATIILTHGDNKYNLESITDMYKENECYKLVRGEEEIDIEEDARFSLEITYPKDLTPRDKFINLEFYLNLEGYMQVDGYVRNLRDDESITLCLVSGKRIDIRPKCFFHDPLPVLGCHKNDYTFYLRRNGSIDVSCGGIEAPIYDIKHSIFD